MLYKFFEDYRLFIPWYAGSVSKAVSKDIIWDEEKTNILSARLHGKIWAQMGTQGLIKFNGSDILFADATLMDTAVEDTVDVIGLLRNGTNKVEILLWKPLPGLDKSGVFTAELTIEFEGEVPSIEPPWKKYIMPGLAAASVIFSAVGVGLALRRRE